MMSRRRFLRAVSASLLVAPRLGEAQQAARVARVGFLAQQQPTPNSNFAALRHGLHDRGWIEGQSLVIEYRWGSLDRAPALMAELVGLKPDVIVVSAISTVTAKGDEDDPR